MLQKHGVLICCTARYLSFYVQFFGLLLKMNGMTNADILKTHSFIVERYKKTH